MQIDVWATGDVYVSWWQIKTLLVKMVSVQGFEERERKREKPDGAI